MESRPRRAYHAEPGSRLRFPELGKPEYADREWKLSPAYDVVPTMPVSQKRCDLALSCGDRGRYAHADNLLSQCARFYLKREGAATIIADMEARVSETWYETARREGVSEQDCEKIRSAFVYPGFRL